MARCTECGANLSGNETCLDRYHAVLTADYSGVPEAISAHGLFVLTYQSQHPSREALADNIQPGAIDRLKIASVAEESPAVGTPIAGKQPVAGIDPAIPPGHVARVGAWARSVAEHRFMDE